MTTKEIAKALDKSEGSASKNLRKLHNRGDIMSKKNEVYNGGCFWKVKD